MGQFTAFFKKLFDSSDWPPRWHCGQWTEFHGWLYIISDLLIWSAYFTIPVVIIRFISKKQDIRFTRLYFMFAAFILACGATHFLDALAFWIPVYRLNALARFITGVVSWATVFYLVKYLPFVFSLKSQKELEIEIGQRKKAEEKFRGLLEAAPDAMVITNENGEIVLVNRQTETMFGYTKEELIGRKVEILIPARFHSRHVVDRISYFENPKVRTMGAGLELFAKRKDGSQIPVEISLSPLVTEDGTLVSASIRDITLRKISEENLSKAKKDYQLLVSSIKDYAIIMLDKEGHIASWNSGAEYIKGYKAEEIIGKPMEVFYTSEEIENGEPERNLQLALEKGNYETEGWRVRKDGSEFFANIVFTSLIDEEGKLYGYAKVTKDITEKRKAEESIRFLASIANSIQDPVISSDNEYFITQWNEAAEELFEWKTGEVIGKKANELLKVSYTNDTRAQILKSLNENDFWQGEVIYHTKSGKPINALATASHLKDEKGNINGNLILIRDITKRKQAEQALSKLNEELEQRVQERTKAVEDTLKEKNIILESIGDAFFAVDKDWMVTYWNRIAEQDLQVLKEQIIGKNLWDIFTESIDSLSYTKYHQALAQNQMVHFEDYYPFLNKWYEISAYPSVSGLSVYFKDVTERKKMQDSLIEREEQLEMFIEHSPASLAMLDKHMMYIAASQRWINDFGLDGQALIGKSHYEIFPEIPQRWKEIHQRCLNGAIEKNDEDLFIREDGSRNWIRWEVRPWHRASGEIGGIIIFSEEITERKNAEEKIRNLNIELEEKVISRTEQLRKTNEELEAFTYSVSHDLRAPLRGIIGFTTILEEDYASKLDDEARRITNVIKSNTIKMGQLIDDLLDFSRMGKQQIIKAKIDTASLLKDVVRELTTQYMVHNEISWDIRDLLPMDADMNTMRQVWINLISNAIKYSGNKKKPHIEIGSYEKDGQHVFYVQDNGAGFDEQYNQKLFQVFQRLHTEEEFEGTGVGLALVEKIVSKHGGKVWAKGRENVGACFSFSLPA